MTVDPDRAARLHPNERRKIVRSLQVYEQHGKTHSQLLEKQKEDEGSALGGGLRFPRDRICIIEVFSEQEILIKRCNKRVDKMIARGMVKELQDFHQNYNKTRVREGKEVDYTTGIFQSIGFKEFHEYLVLGQDERESDGGKEMFDKCAELLKIATRQYSKKQARWMRRRFLLDEREAPHVYRVDSSKPELWQEIVFNPALDIVNAFVEEKEPSAKPLEKISHEHSFEDLRRTIHCDLCERDFKGLEQYKQHVNGKRHKKNVKVKAATKVVRTKYVLKLESFDDSNKAEAVKELKNALDIPISDILEKMKNVPAEIADVKGEGRAKEIVEKMKMFNVQMAVQKVAYESSGME